MHYAIKDLNKNERPREKLYINGVSALTDEELLAVILRTGGKNLSAVELAREVINTCGDFTELVNVDIHQLIKIKNIDNVKACCIKALGEISLRSHLKPKQFGIKIQLPEDVYKFMKPLLYRRQKEHLYVLSLNSRNLIISRDLVTLGTINETIMYPRDILKIALQKSAVSIIIVHNHPSNDANPSSEDIKATHRVFSAATEMGINLIDHVIVCDNSYISLKTLGLLNSNKQKEGGEQQCIKNTTNQS